MVEDRYACSVPDTGSYEIGRRSHFRGWLKGLKWGIKRFLLLAGSPDGPPKRVTFQSVAREGARLEMEGSGGGASSPGTAYRESLCRDAYFEGIQGHCLPTRVDKEDVWPSSGEEPAPLTPPPSLLRGDGDDEADTDGGPRGPRIIRQEVLTGPARVDVRRIVRATEEEGARMVDVEMISDDSLPGAPHHRGTDVYEDTSEEERARGQPGPLRPLKRARGRPRKDGTGPFRAPTYSHYPGGRRKGV